MKVLIAAPVNSLTGYGNDGIELIQAMIRWGADVYVAPASVFPPLPRDVAAVLTKPIPPVVDLLISHTCPQQLAKTDHCGIFAAATVALAWTMWEWDSLSNVDIIDPLNCEHAFRVTDHLRDSLGRFDAVLAYDDVSKQALTPYHDNISILQGGVTPLDPMKRDWFANPFRFFMCGVLSARKDPFSAIKAYKTLRDAGELSDATLTLKSSHSAGFHPSMEGWCSGLKIITEMWTMSCIHDLYRQSHVMLSPSWGEGKNRPAIEFATSGGAVVGPFIGGHAQWMSRDYSWLLDYELKDYGAGAHGASVKVSHLAEIMLEIYNDRSSTRLRAETAARCLPSMVNWNAVLERLCLRLPAVAGGRGSEVSALMKACRRSLQSDAVNTAAVRSAFERV